MLDTFLAIIGILLAAMGSVIAYLQLRRTPKKAHVGQYDPPVISPITRNPRHNLLAQKSLVGRSSELARVRDGILSSVTVISLEGLGGIGKTAIAWNAAWRAANGVLGRNFQAIIWVEGRAGDLTLDKIIDTVAQVIEYPYLKALKTEEKQEQVIQYLEQIPTLLIIDNFETIEDERLGIFLNTLPPNTKVIVTTRERLFEDAWAVEVGGLPRADAEVLLMQEANRMDIPSVLTAPRALIDNFLEAIEGNPLAIRLSLGQVHRGASSFAHVVNRLQNTGSAEILTAIFQRTWSHFLVTNEDARRVITVMSLHSASVSIDAIESGSDVRGDSLTAAIERLVELSLLDVYENPISNRLRYQIHALTRTFVRHQASSESELVSELEKRLIKYYVTLASHREGTYDSIINIQALEIERNNLLTFAKRSYSRAASLDDTEIWRLVIEFANSLAAYLWGRGYWRDRLDLCEHALEASKEIGNRPQISRQHTLIGRVHLWLGDITNAKQHLYEAELAIEGNQNEIANAVPKRLSAQIASREGNYELAHGLLTDVLKSAPLTVDDEGRAATLIELGIVAGQQQSWQDAKTYFEEALKLDERLATLEGQAVSLSHLGNAQLSMGEHSVATRSFLRGLELATQVDRLSTKGRCQYGLAQVNLTIGEIEISKQYARAAVESFTKLGMKDMVDAALMLVSDQ